MTVAIISLTLFSVILTVMSHLHEYAKSILIDIVVAITIPGAYLLWYHFRERELDGGPDDDGWDEGYEDGDV